MNRPEFVENAEGTCPNCTQEEHVALITEVYGKKVGIIWCVCGKIYRLDQMAEEEVLELYDFFS